VVLDTLVAPLELVGDDAGRLIGLRLQEMHLADTGADGRRVPEPVPGQVRQVPVDVAIIAIGNRPNPLLLRTTTGLDQTERGTLVVDADTGQTSKEGVFAGGDIVTGGATVILAMGAGRKAAKAIDHYLRTEPAADWTSS